MVWESTLGCFVTGGMPDLQCVLGGFFTSFVGSPILMTIVALLFSVLICWRMKLPLDLSVIFILGLVIVANYSFMPEWIRYFVLIATAVGVAAGFYKFFKSR